MTNITFLGLGAMGSRMAEHLIKADHQVTVWNRTADKAEVLVQQGATLAPSPKAAVATADIVISMVRDDEASQQVWLDKATGALAAMPAHAIAVESSTLTPAWVTELASACAKRDLAFADAPVAGSRPQAEAGQLIYFVGTDGATFAKLKPVLSLMGGAVHHAGDAGTGAHIKLAVNALFGIQLTAVGELLGVLQKSNVDLEAAMAIIGATPVCSPAAKLSASAMIAGNFAPMFPISLVEKDFSYVEATAQLGEADTPLSTATRRALKVAMGKGFGNDNITGIAQLFLD